MKSFILLITIIVLQNVWVRINAETLNTSVLGIAPCMYAGDFDKYGTFCPYDPMPLDWIPKECTSFVYDGLICHPDFTFSFSEKDERNVIALGSSDKPLYLYYGYETTKAWIEAMNGSNTKNEAESLHNFLSGYNVVGLILKNLNYDYSSNLDYHFDESFYDNFQQYITTMRTINCNLTIGLYINARNMIFYTNNQMSPDWFKFLILNYIMDFYIIGFDKFNPCNEFFKNGIAPNDNVLQYNNSLSSFAAALRFSPIAKGKIYLEFSASPTVNDSTTEDLPTCCVTYKKYCEDDHYNLYWCADNSDAFYDKGKFAREIKAQGFVTKYIDTIDPTTKCKCNSDKFITFSMMLRGFLCEAPITDCTKLNSIT
ncbi:unnamed protein product [Macrosiphum euphorbiae]|uniref:GH18 domain-containing protein n=1 Tax=Macrosiphum euphorbiae TaxID=13131 RepID=A0AAV0X1L6_9HEMI|nr:unnamed protein product [Macrosiphum euphorbiae]